MSIDEVTLDAEERMEKALAHLKNNLAGIRTGRATPGLVDSVRVTVYGSKHLSSNWHLSVPPSQINSLFARLTQVRSRILKRQSLQASLD